MRKPIVSLGVLLAALTPALAPAIATPETARYIVALRDDARSGQVVATAHSLAGRYGGRVGAVYDRILHGFSADLTPASAAALADDPAVASVEADRPMRTAGTQANPPSWGLDRVDQRYLPLDGSYTYQDSAAPATVVVVDTGVRASHTDFGGRVNFLIDNVGDGLPAGEDCNGHGTAVASVIGGARYGVAKDVNLLSIRVADCTGATTVERVIDALNNVVASGRVPKPAVVNLSLELTCADCATALNKAVKDTVASGYPVVVAAGNTNRDACTVPGAGAAEAITVGATTRTDARRGDSNFGPCVDLWAPGDDITTAGNASNTASATYSGTSIAAPHVAGVAAMILSQGITMTPAEVMAKLRSTSTTQLVTGIGGTDTVNRLLSTGTQARRGERWAYLMADQQSATGTYTPNLAYQGNSSGAQNTVTRTGLGEYDVRFPGVGGNTAAIGAGGVVHVTAVGGLNPDESVNTAWCKGYITTETATDVMAHVLCFIPGRIAGDSRFDITFTATTISTGDYGYAMVPWNGPSTQQVTPQSYQFNTSGRLNLAQHFGLGEYWVWFPGLGSSTTDGYLADGAVTVTAIDSGRSYCTGGGWYKSGDAMYVQVRCFGPLGQPMDSSFEITFARDTSLLGVDNRPGAAYLRSSGVDGTSGGYTPRAAWQFNSTGNPNRVHHLDRGLYTVELPGLGSFTGGDVQIMTETFGALRCKSDNWYGNRPVQDLWVLCYDVNGNPHDAGFVISWVR